MSNQKITDHRKHFVPAIYNWMVENFDKIYVSFIRKHPGVDCPPCNYSTDQFGVQTQEDGPATIYNIEMVTLNFGVEAVGNFAFDSEGIVANIRFGGKLANVRVPFSAIKRIYSPDRSDLGYFLNQPFSQEDIKFTNEILNNAPSNSDQVAKTTNHPTDLTGYGITDTVGDSKPKTNKDRPTLVRIK